MNIYMYITYIKRDGTLTVEMQKKNSYRIWEH